MKLKQITLQGYKTFASKTEFLFDEGITAIVGPNGSGKSNVADALRWVLGEQSYGTLRGKRTTDMIFAGSQSRARAGMAQVILTLDNSHGWLPIAYSEVEIGRRAYRSGENEYLLNGQKVRLKDITDLLATSGLAERTYTIIGQGLIDQALSLRAEERRALFEEAAGINHYKSKRAETLRRLEETQHNLQRVHDILAEIRPRLVSLKRQATRARNYDQVLADLRHLLRLWYGYKWEKTKESLRLARQTAVSTEQIWQDSRHRLLAQQESMNTLRQRINQYQSQLTDQQTHRDNLRDQFERAQRDVAILSERQQSILRQLADMTQELPLLETQRQAAATDLDMATAELVTAQANLETGQAKLRQFHTAYQAQQTEASRRQTDLRQAEQTLRQRQQQQAQAEGQLTQLRERLADLQATSATDETPRLRHELETLAAQLEKEQRALTTAQTRATDLRQQRLALQEQRQVLITELKTLRRTAGEQERTLAAQQRDLAALTARVQLLDRLRQQTAPIPADVPTLGQLAGLLTIPPAHHTAVSATLATRLATLILPHATALWRVLSTPGTTFTAAALSDIQPPPRLPLPTTATPTTILGWAADQVQVPAALQPVVELLLGRVLLVTTDAIAYEMAHQLPPGSLAVSTDGLVAHAGGLVERRRTTDADNLLAREAEWRQAQMELTQLQRVVQERETAVATQNRHLQDKQTQADQWQNEERRLGNLEQEAGQRVTQAQRSVDRLRQQQEYGQRQIESVAQRTAARQAEQTRLQERLTSLEAGWGQWEGEIKAAETAVQQTRTQLNAIPLAEAGQQRQSHQQTVAAAQTIVAGRQAVVDSRRTTLRQMEQQIGRLRQRHDALQAELSHFNLHQQKETSHHLQTQITQLDQQLQPIRNQLTSSRQQMRDLEAEMAQMQRRTLELETQYTQAQVRLTQQENQTESLQERIKTDLGIVALVYDEGQTGPTPLPISGMVAELPKIIELPEDIEETIHNYRGQIQRMGAINPDAPEEYDKTQERHDFLTQQVEDLNQTETQLRAVIAELDTLTSQAFAETVSRVNLIFAQTFTQLFGGGAARLILTDPDDLTISGVDIIARLPNRREQGLALLSGGERALTAAALIFSLLKVSPTPFCVLDEVDAALDEANINRFRDLLTELSLKTQFILITHNRGTVQAAQTIYGISMGNDSTSQCISIKPEEYLKQPPLIEA